MVSLLLSGFPFFSAFADRMRDGISFWRMREEQGELAVSQIGERYGVFLIVSPRAEAAMVQSLRKYGQISPVVCVQGGRGSGVD